MRLMPETIEIQEKFARYCRTGKLDNIPGIAENRIHHYKRLTNNVVFSTLEQAFPITVKILSAGEWNTLLMEFIKKHDSKTPQIWKLPFEFFEFAKENNWHEVLEKPWLDDLLYFEWIEIEIHTMPDSPVSEFVNKEDISPNDILIFNPDFRIIKLAYPVHLYPIEQVINKKANFFVLVYRELDTGNVRFIDLTVLFAVLLEKLTIEKQTFGHAVNEISLLFGIENENLLENKIKSFISELKNQGFYLGVSV